MATITWRNVNDSGTDSALRSLMAASSGVGNAFGALQGVVKDVEAADKVAFEQSKERNTNSFLDALQSRYTTPEAMQAAIASGEAEQFRQSFGNKINSSATRGAADARLTNLRQQGLADMQYNNQVADDADQAALSQAQAAALRGDPQAQQFVDRVSARNQGKAAKTLFDAENALFGQTVAKNSESRAGEKHSSDLKTAEAQRASAFASAAASRASAANSAVRTQLAQVELGDAQNARQFQKMLQGDIQQHQRQTAIDKQQIREIAKANPMMAPLDKNGELDLNRMNQGQRDSFEAMLNNNKLSLNTYLGSDTNAAQRSVDKLIAAGAPLSVVDKAREGAANWYNTSAPAAIGNDAKTAAQSQRQREISDQRKVDAAGGIPTKAGDFTEVMKIIGPSIPKKDGDLIKKAVSDYYRNGGTVVEGEEDQGKRYLPANVIAQIVQGQEDGWAGFIPFNSAGRDTSRALKAAEKDFVGKLAGVIKSETDRQVRSVNSPSGGGGTDKKKKSSN